MYETHCVTPNPGIFDGLQLGGIGSPTLESLGGVLGTGIGKGNELVISSGSEEVKEKRTGGKMGG